MDQETFGADDMSGATRISRDKIKDLKIRDEIPLGAEIYVEKGENFDFESIKIDEQIPRTRKFSVYKYKNPRT